MRIELRWSIKCNANHNILKFLHRPCATLERVPSVFVLVAASTSICFVPKLRTFLGLPAIFPSNIRFSLVLSAIVAALIWLPPVIEQIQNSPGNLVKLLNFALNSGLNDHVWEAIVLFSQRVSCLGTFMLLPYPSLDSGSIVGLISLIAVLVQGSLLPICFVINIRQGQDFGAYLCLISGLALLAALWSTIHIQGQAEPYLLDWMSAISATSLIGIGCAIFQPIFNWLHTRPRSAVHVSLWLLVFAVAVCIQAPLWGRLIEYRAFRGPTEKIGANSIRKLSQSLLKYFSDKGIRRPIISMEVDGSNPLWAVGGDLPLNSVKVGKILRCEKKVAWCDAGKEIRTHGMRRRMDQAPQRTAGGSRQRCTCCNAPCF